MSNLRQPIDSLIKPIVEAMDEDENFASSHLLSFCGKCAAERLIAEMFCRNRHKIPLRVSGQRQRPLHFAYFSCAVGRYRNVDRGVGNFRRSVAAKQLARVPN